MSRGIDFSNVNISIQEFQKLSQGDYNAGEVKLSSETRLTKINNHVHWVSLNNTKLDHTEVMVIKDAFVRALSSNGVGVDEINRVRSELGLAPTDANDKTLADRSCKPLSRQQIRQILDRNAEAINASAGGATIRTSAQLYAGRSESKQAQVLQKREAAEAATAKQRGIDTNRLISVYQQTLAGDTDFLPQGDRELALGYAKDQRNSILQRSNNAPSAERQCELTFTTSASGASVRIAAGASEAEVVRRLDEQIQRLTYSKGPNDAQMAAREEFLAVGRGCASRELHSARYSWTTDLGTQPLKMLTNEGSIKLRTAAVVLMQERGVHDFATLSRVNDMSISDIYVLAFQLSADHKHRIAGDALLGRLEECPHCNVEAEGQAYIPAFSPKECNAVFSDVLTSKDPQRVIPHDVAMMASECRAEAARHFGDGIAAVEEGVSGFARDADIQNFCEVESAADREVILDSLRECYLESGLEVCADKFVAAEFKTILEGAGCKNAETAKRLAGLLEKAHPELQKQLVDAGSPEAARGILSGLSEEMRGLAERGATVDSLHKDGWKPLLQDCLMESASTVGMALGLETIGFSEAEMGVLQELSDKIESGEHSAKSPEEIRGAFRAIAQPIIQERMAMIDQTVLAVVNGTLFNYLPTNAEKLAIFGLGTERGAALREAYGRLSAEEKTQPERIKRIVVDILFQANNVELQNRIDASYGCRQYVEQAALKAGYHPSEISTLCNVFRLYQLATHCSTEVALKAALDSNSPARRLYSFGGRFVTSLGNFAKGLRLQEQFKDWFAGMVQTIEAQKNANAPQTTDNSSITLLNAEDTLFRSNCAPAFEKFLFEEIAGNAEIPLESEDPEQIFGMEHNPATALFGRNYSTGYTTSLAQMPPKLRHFVYGLFELVAPLRTSVNQPKEKDFSSEAQRFTACVMRHIDEIRLMESNGTLTRENLLTLLFPNVPDLLEKSLSQIITWDLYRIQDEIIPKEFNGDQNLLGPIGLALNSSGLPLEEVARLMKENSPIPDAPYMASYTSSFHDLDGTTQGARKQALMDLPRPDGMTYYGTTDSVLSDEQNAFVARFPDGSEVRIHRDIISAAGARAAEEFADAVEKFVGASHPEQLSSVLYGISQSGLSCLKQGLLPYGISSTEHAPVRFTFARDENSGAITIHYSEPEGCPVKFHWDCYIALDGKSVTTPMVVEA